MYVHDLAKASQAIFTMSNVCGCERGNSRESDIPLSQQRCTALCITFEFYPTALPWSHLVTSTIGFYKIRTCWVKCPSKHSYNEVMVMRIFIQV